MNYSKKDIENLVSFLKRNKAHEYLGSFLKDHIDCGNINMGLCEPGSVGSAVVIRELGELIPDALHALRLPDEKLPLYITKDIGIEYAIACWRMDRLNDASSNPIEPAMPQLKDIKL